MAYVKPGQQNSGSFRIQSGGGNTVAKTTTTDSSVLFSTGLFAPDNEKSKAMATVKIKEDLVIPAGSYINLYENEATSERSPKIRLQIRKASVKK